MDQSLPPVPEWPPRIEHTQQTPSHTLTARSVARWWVGGGLAFFLLFPSVAIVHKLVGLAGLVVYLVGASLILWLLRRYRWYAIAARLTERQALVLVLLTFGGLILIFALLYPLADAGRLGSGGSDNDDALTIATQALLAGDYPYYQRTYLDNPISPLPGLLVLATPAVLLGNAAYLALLALPLFFVVVRHHLQSGGLALLLIWLLLGLAPGVGHALVTGSDYLFNTVAVLALMVGSLWLAHRPGASRWLTGLVALLLGLALASRANFLLLVPLLAAGLAAARGWRYAGGYLLIVGATTLLITVPFYLYDPVGFSPLHTANKLTRFNVVVPRADLLIGGATALLALWLATRSGNDQAVVLCRRAAYVLILPAVAGVVLSSLFFQALEPSYSFFGLFGLFFGAFGLWSELVADALPTAALPAEHTTEQGG